MRIIHEAGRRGHEVYCFAPDWNPYSFRTVTDHGAAARALGLARMPLSPLADRKALSELSAAFGTLKPHVVLSIGLKASAVSTLANRRVGIPHIVPMLFDCGDALAPETGQSSWATRQLIKPVLWWALRASQGVILRDEDDAELLAARGLLPEKLKVTCIGAPGIDVDRIPHLALPPLDRGAIFLVAADLDRRHGILDYCEAAEILRTRARNARCVLTGRPVNGPAALSLEELRRYRSAIQYLGPRDDVVQLVARSHVLVVPSHGMGRPDILLAALAIGRPIIATATKGLRDAVDHGINGYLVPPRNPQALAKAMAQLLMRPDLIPRMANASRVIAERKFDVRAVTYSVMNALKL